MQRQMLNQPGVSTYSFRDEVLGIGHLDEIRSAGFAHLELMANRPHLDYHDRQVHREIAGWLRSNPLETLSMHLPFLEQTGAASFRWISALAPEEPDRRKAADEIKRALELTDSVPVSWIVIHLGIPNQSFSPVHFDYAYALVDMIRRFAGVDIVIENIPNEISRPERIEEFVRLAAIPEIRICYDIGHCHLDAGPLKLDKIGAVHLSDNDGVTDQHLWPFDGTVDWPQVAAAIVDSGFDGPLTVEGPGPDLAKAFDSTNRFRNLLKEAHTAPDEFERTYMTEASDSNRSQT